jgi:hypothetical protein
MPPRCRAQGPICCREEKTREDELTYPRIVHAALLTALPCIASAQSAAPAPPEVLRVTRYADDGNEGSLRFAIEASNRAPDAIESRSKRWAPRPM